MQKGFVGSLIGGRHMSKIIWIVDDHGPTRQLVKDLLEPLGFKVHMFSGVGETMSELQTGERPNLVICDIKMPFYSGWDMLKMWRQKPDTAGIPFAILSGDTSAATRQKALRAHVTGFIVKPFHKDDFILMVRRLTAAEAPSDPFMPALQGVSPKADTVVLKKAGA